MSSSRITVPNIISIARMALAPAVALAVVAGRLDIAFWLFALGCLSDAVDGAIARAMQQLSRLGAQLDPLADKAMILAAMWSLYAMGIFDLWLTVLVSVRDAGIVVGTLLLRRRGIRFAVQPISLSKLATVLQMGSVLAVLAVAGLDWLALARFVLPLILVADVVTALTLLGYLRRGISLWRGVESEPLPTAQPAAKPPQGDEPR